MKKTKPALHLLIFSLLLLLFTGFLPQKAHADFQKTKIAILDFVLYGDELNTKGMGAILSEWFITSIVKNGRFDVVERAMLQKIISEQKLATTGLIDENSATELGKILGVKVIITGSVLKLKDTVEINSRVISVESGSIIAAENIRGGANSDLQMLVELLTKRIIRNFPLTGYIVKKNPKSVIIDLGLTAGLDAGTEFIVYKEGAVIKHPKTGEVLDVEQILTGRIRITKVRRNVAEGLILSEKNIGIAYGQMVQSSRATNTIQPPPPPAQSRQKKEVLPRRKAAEEKVTLKPAKRKIVVEEKAEIPPQPAPTASEQKAPEPAQPAPTRPEILNIAIFPWLFVEDANRLSSYLIDAIIYRIKDLDKLKLTHSYYKRKRVAPLHVSDSSRFYFNRSQPNISRIKKISNEKEIHLAVLGKLDVECRWSDNCLARRLEIMIVDTATGDIISLQGGGWDHDAREAIDSTVKKAFRRLERKTSAD